MAKIFHGGIKIKGEEGKVALKKSYLEKKGHGLDGAKGERVLEIERVPSRLNMWKLYKSVHEGILVILDM